MVKPHDPNKCPRCGSRHITIDYTTEPKQAKCKDCRKVFPYTGTTYFNGELMTCAVCGKEQQSDPKVESQWRIIKLDDQTCYICTDHFPPDGATKEAFSDAYYKIISNLVSRQD